MKKLLIILAVSYLFHGCKKEDPEIYGWAKAWFNNREWKADKVRCIRQNKCWNGPISVELKQLTKQGLLKELVTFTFYPVPEEQLLKTTTSRPLGCTNDSVHTVGYYTYEPEGDVAKDRYEPMENEKNTMTVMYNESNKTINGTFHLNLVLNNNNVPDRPDTLRIRDGAFFTKIMAEY